MDRAAASRIRMIPSDDNPGHSMHDGGLCLVTAVNQEFKVVTGLLDDGVLDEDHGLASFCGNVGKSRITVLRTEMGARGFSRLFKEHLIGRRKKYDALIMVGFAGALDPALKRGDCIIYNRCLSLNRLEISGVDRRKPMTCGENAGIETDHHLSERLSSEIRNAGAPCCYGSGLTTPGIITESREKLSLGEMTGTRAVDMETFGVLETARDLGIPAAAVRVISDQANADLPDFNAAQRKDGRLDHWQLSKAMLARPIASLRFFAGIKSVLASFHLAVEAILVASDGLTNGLDCAESAAVDIKTGSG